jgi:protein NRD1
MNTEKRCAFLKMYTREGAINAREGMESFPFEDTTIRTKYGVGFGPRDCSDYSSGISIVPISRLTDADRKWVVSAEYGGTGGRPLEAGMIIEEPDIEIGAGVSSKAISQKMHLRGYKDGNRNDGGNRTQGRKETRWDQQGGNQFGQGQQGQGGGQPPMFPPFPMMPGQPAMFPPGQFPPFMMTPQMQHFFQQQFGGQGQGQGQPDQDGQGLHNQGWQQQSGEGQ